ncbi:MAG: FAD-dependent oxidoreductase, partial [candidate division NC10 bacterium]
GPRYCPSIEDKVVKFPDKERHQIFLEPEGLHTYEVYVNGISTSMPIDVQCAVIASIPGLERAEMMRPGYAIEYDFVPPDQIDATLMAKRVRGLFLAGQINGTSGYEEAAGQGIVAGINAARFAGGLEPVTVGRDQAYIGVMIDDIVTRAVDEPYRMFTSRAEHRMHLRYDNADARLTPFGHEVGLVKADRWALHTLRMRQLESLFAALRSTRSEGRSLLEWLKRPEEDGARFRGMSPVIDSATADADLWQRALVIVKYGGYIERQRRAIERFHDLEDRHIPSNIDYGVIPHLRHEARERWAATRPRSVGQAARIGGIHPTDVSILLVHLCALGRQPCAGGGNLRD